MKRSYFMPETISAEAEIMRERVRQWRIRADMIFKPSRSALLILDMQDYFLDDSSHAYIPSAAAIIPKQQALIRGYATRWPVVFTRHINTPEDAGMMASWWRELILPENPLSRITPQLDTSNAKVMEKHQYDAFFGTELDGYLRKSSVEQVLICGVMTHLCCETTARSAFMRGYKVFFAVDGTATYHAAFHEATLVNLSHGFAQLVLVDEILAVL
jgi:bifunctional isochorismate lyase/aryl carrier protein